MTEPSVLPYGRQSIDDDDIAAVVRVLKSDYLTTGPEVDAFERELAESCGARYAVVVSNGTAALHCAYAAAGIGPGDEVVTTPLTFSATSNTVLALGGRPVFADIDDSTLCLDPARAAAAIGPKTKAISPVDFAGHPCDADRFREIASQHGLMVIVDASHSIGGRYRDRPVGSLGQLTTFSFHPVKSMTTGEGGAVLTNDQELAERARAFRNHGLVRDPSRLGGREESWYYEIQSLGLNYRLTDFQCALGRSQLRKLGRFVTRRSELVARYRRNLEGVAGLQMQRQRAEVNPAWHLFVIRVAAGIRGPLHAALKSVGILTQVHYLPVNGFPLYQKAGYRSDSTPVAAAAADGLLSLPLFPAMSDQDVDRVSAEVIRSLATL